MSAIALVGCAHIHTPGFANRLRKRPDVRVGAVWDHDAARAEDYAAKLQAPVAELARIWDDPAIAAVVICSETVRHPDLVAAAVAAKKHLFVEKPLGTTAAEAHAMARAIQDAGVIFQTGFFRRGHRANLTLKSLLAKGTLGTVTRVRDTNMHHGLLGGWFDGDFRWMTDPAQAGVGAFGDMGAHSVDLLTWLFGRVASATGSLIALVGKYPGCDESGEALLRFANGTNASIGAGWLDHANPIATQVSGTKGFAYIQNGELFVKCPDLTGADDFQPYSEFDADLPHAFELFLDAIAGQKNVPLVPVTEAAHGTAVVEAIYRGSAEQRWVEPR
jgi:predicted dehydrogenase